MFIFLTILIGVIIKVQYTVITADMSSFLTQYILYLNILHVYVTCKESNTTLYSYTGIYIYIIMLTVVIIIQ